MITAERPLFPRWWEELRRRKKWCNSFLPCVWGQKKMNPFPVWWCSVSLRRVGKAYGIRYSWGPTYSVQAFIFSVCSGLYAVRWQWHSKLWLCWDREGYGRAEVTAFISRDGERDWERDSRPKRPALFPHHKHIYRMEITDDSCIVEWML